VKVELRTVLDWLSAHLHSASYRLRCIIEKAAVRYDISRVLNEKGCNPSSSTSREVALSDTELSGFLCLVTSEGKASTYLGSHIDCFCFMDTDLRTIDAAQDSPISSLADKRLGRVPTM